MTINFLEDLRDGKFPSPTQKNFKLEDWNGYAHKYNITDENTLKIIEIGFFFHNLFTVIRQLVTSTPDQTNQISRTESLKYLVGKVNQQICTKTGIILDNNVVRECDMGELAKSISEVDWLKVALTPRFNNHSIKCNREINDEIFLASIYSVYENLWLGILYNALEFSFDASKKTFWIFQKDNQEQMAAFIAQKRRVKRMQHEALIALTLPSELCNLSFLNVKLTGRRATFYSEINNENLSKYNLVFINRLYEFKESFPTELLNIRCSKYSFNINEVLEIVRNLSIISASIVEQLESRKITNITLYAPILNQTNMVKAVSFRQTCVNQDKNKH